MFTKTVYFKNILRRVQFDVNAMKYGSVTSPNTVKKDFIKNEPKVAVPRKATREVLEYIDSLNDNKDIKSLVSPYLLNIHKCAPEHLYLVCHKTAKSIAKLIEVKLKGGKPVFEINPGFGCLTTELLKAGVENLKLIEASSLHEEPIKSLQAEHPGLDVYFKDFFAIDKLEYLDKQDGGNRTSDFFPGVGNSSIAKEADMMIVGAAPTHRFIRYLILSVVFQRGIIEMGNPEFFITLPPTVYYNMVPYNTDKKYATYRYRPVLFNLLFDVELLAKVQRKSYLPWQSESSLKGLFYNKDKRFLELDHKYLFLINLKLKPSLPCAKEHLPLLWYFLKQHTHSKHNRVIPKLEQWIPGCGIWLITGQDPPGTDLNKAPNENDAPLPHITIFTEFSELTPAEKLTVFKKFISWPDFKQTAFVETLNNLQVKYNNATFIDSLDQDDEMEQ